MALQINILLYSISIFLSAIHVVCLSKTVIAQYFRFTSNKVGILFFSLPKGNVKIVYMSRLDIKVGKLESSKTS